MFETGYAFTELHRKPASSEHYLYDHKFKFKEGKRVYHVDVEQYRHNIYVVKFYPDKYSNNPHRYSIVLNDCQYPQRIIRTCVNIMLYLLNKDKLASFGFIGAHKTIHKRRKPNEPEPDEKTQRYRIYRGLAANLFGHFKFTHVTNEKKSAYLLANNENEDIEQLIKDAILIFSHIYPQLELREQEPIRASIG